MRYISSGSTVNIWNRRKMRAVALAISPEPKLLRKF